ncbi:MAG: protein-disulfide reductase DsbD family protein [Planctomycetota bacterium]|jgi:thiol:disulfide interchange protein DsbD
MKTKKYYLFVNFQILFILSLLIFANCAECGINTPVIDASYVGSDIELKSGSKAKFNIRIVIPKDHHAYLDKGDDGFFIPIEFDFTDIVNAGYKCKIEVGPEGEREDKVSATVLRGENTYSFSIEDTGHSIPNNNLQIKLSYQLCNDISNICYPPATASIFIPISKSEYSAKLSQEGIDIVPGLGATANSTTQDDFVDSVSDKSMVREGEGVTGWLLARYHEYSRNIFVSFLFMFIAGILAAATPCVYPMLPITSALLMQRGDGSREKGVRHAVVYFLGIILVYMIMGYIAGMTGGALNIIMKSAVVNIVLALFFAFLALSMLGFYDFTFGQGLHVKSDASVKSKAGYTGTFLMGMLAGLVISPCVGPVVFALLLQITERVAELSSELLAMDQKVTFFRKSMIAGRGGILMGAFGMGIGIPFLLVGLFSNKMPKAGSWMVYVKYALGLGILFFAFSYYMKGMGVAHVNPGAAYGILLGLVSIFSSVYLGLIKKWNKGIMSGERLKKSLSLILLIFGIYFFFTGFVKSGLLFESKSTRARMESTEVAVLNTEKDGNLIWQRSYEDALVLARKENKPIFIDFYADWCANCIAFKKLSLRNMKLNKALKKVVLLKIYDTDTQFKAFQDNPLYAELKTGLPFFVILKPDGEFFWKGTQYNAVNTMKEMVENAGKL